MPTGYTQDIKDGIAFSQFALGCARAFGACITMRDEPSGGDKIPEELQPSDYHFKALAEARETLATLESMTTMECGFKAAAEHKNAEFQRLARIKELDDLRQKYEEMLVCAQAWTPPTAEHYPLKEFMVNQITESIKWDCDASFYQAPATVLSGADWLESAKAKAIEDIGYHKKKWAEEVQRTEQRNTWVRQLRESL